MSKLVIIDIHKCFKCNKEFLNNSNLKKHTNKVKSCIPVNPIITNEPTTDLKQEIQFLRNEINEIKQLLLNFIKPVNNNIIIEPIEIIEIINPSIINVPVKPIEIIEIINPSIINEPIEPIEIIEIINPSIIKTLKVKKTKKIKTIKPIEPVNNIKIDDDIEPDADLITNDNLIPLMQNDIINSSYFKNIVIDVYNEITDKYDITNITVLNDTEQFIADIFKSNKTITYMDKMQYYIKIYMSILNKNIKPDIKYTTINSFRDALEETIRNIIITTIKHEDNEKIQSKLIEINRAIDSKHYKDVNNILWELLKV